MMTEKCWAIAATTYGEHGETVYWQNTGQPTVWQPEPGEWLFTKEVATEIANRMQGATGVCRIRPMFIERTSFDEAKKEAFEQHGETLKRLASN